MPLPNLKDVFTAFSPSADFLAITTGDGRIKIWDTVNGQMQSEFSDIAGSNLGTSDGHLSVDYSCMKWSPNMGKKRKKGKKSLLVLGTGVGDVLALDPMLGEVKWRCSDCHPGGTRAISFASNGRVVYTTGVDGMVCELDSETGNLIEKFGASKKAISCLAVSSDGRSLATAGAELKHFSLPDKKKLQKFTGHPNSVRVMMFATSGKHIISSAAGERHVAVWKCDGSKESGAAASVLSMEQPAVALDCKASGEDGEGLSVLAVSESGVAYIWHSESVEELNSAKPSKVTVSLGKEESSISKSSRKSRPCVFAAKLQGIGSDSSLAVLAAYGNLVKPSFERLEVMKKGKDIILSASESGMLLAAPHDKSAVTIKGQQNGVTALGPANAEDAIFPIPRVEIPDDAKHKTMYEKKRRASDIEATPNEVDDNLMKIDRPADWNAEVVEYDNEPTMEEKLMQLGIIEKEKEDDPSQPSQTLTPIPPNADSVVVLLRQALRSNDILLLVQCLSVRDPTVRKNSVFSLSSADALKLFKSMVYRLKSGPRRAPYILPWIKLVLLRHASSIMSDESSLSFLNTLYQMIESRVSVFQPLLQLSGRLDLINEQISPDIGDETPDIEPAFVYMDESEEDDEEEVVDEDKDMSADESDDGNQEDVTLDQVVDNETMNAGSGRDSDKDSHWRQHIAKGAALEAEWTAKFAAYEKKYPKEAAEFKSLISGKLPEGWEKALPTYTPESPADATRNLSQQCLNGLARVLPGLLGGSADLSTSNMTLLKMFGDFQKYSPAERNFHFGVREHAMASICNGMAFHASGLIPYCATHFVFTDYMRSAMRISALSGTGVIYIHTHDSIGVGQDGPTHQPVEHLASFRAMPNIQMFRPADGKETAGVYKIAVGNRKRPSVLALTRQTLPQLSGTSVEGVEKGGYIISDNSSGNKPDVILIGTGSELQLAEKAGIALRKEGKAVRVVSFVCWELFEEQSPEYKESVLPGAVSARVSVEAGSTFGWSKYVGSKGKSVGIDTFGASAPCEVLFRNFGFTVDNVIAAAKQVIA